MSSERVYEIYKIVLPAVTTVVLQETAHPQDTTYKYIAGVAMDLAIEASNEIWRDEERNKKLEAKMNAQSGGLTPPGS